MYFLYILFLASVICSWNFVSSVVIGLIFITGITKNKLEKGVFFEKKMINFFSIGCLLMYILQITSLLYTENLNEGFKHIQLKSGLVLVPMAVYLGNFLNYAIFRKLMRTFIVVLFITTVYCLIMASVAYWKTHDSSVFFYHQLLLPIEQHAIQFSILVFVALVHLLEEARNRRYYINLVIHFAASVYVLTFLLILSSKLIIVCFFIYLVYYVALTLKKLSGKRYLVPISIVGFLGISLILLFTRNPITKRFNEIMTGEIELIKEEKFNPGIYFNGLQFRLLEWRFVKEILNENHAWLVGVSPADAQHFLDQKYISTNMYIGEPGRGDRGFLGYNTHNQFFESLLQTGVAGLSAFVLICIGLIKMAADIRKPELSVVVALLLFYALNESVFETQYGLMIFLFFPLFLYLSLSGLKPTGTNK